MGDLCRSIKLILKILKNFEIYVSIYNKNVHVFGQLGKNLVCKKIHSIVCIVCIFRVVSTMKLKYVAVCSTHTH